MNAKEFWSQGQYNKDWTIKDQIAVEQEVEFQMELEYERSKMFRFDSYLDPKGAWRLHIVDENGNKLRLAVYMTGLTPKEKVIEAIESGRFAKYCPDIEIDHWWIEKW